MRFLKLMHDRGHQRLFLSRHSKDAAVSDTVVRCWNGSEIRTNNTGCFNHKTGNADNEMVSCVLWQFLKYC